MIIIKLHYRAMSGTDLQDVQFIPHTLLLGWHADKIITQFFPRVIYAKEI